MSARESHKALGDGSCKTRTGHDPHDSAVERKLQQYRSNRLGARLERAHIMDGAPMKDEAEHQDNEDESVDVELKALGLDRVDLIEDAHQHQEHSNDPRVLKDACKIALAPRGLRNLILADEHGRIDRLHLGLLRAHE